MKIFGMCITCRRLVLTGIAAGLGTLAFIEYAPKLLEAKRIRVRLCSLNFPFECLSVLLTVFPPFDRPVAFGLHRLRMSLRYSEVLLQLVNKISAE